LSILSVNVPALAPCEQLSDDRRQPASGHRPLADQKSRDEFGIDSRRKVQYQIETKTPRSLRKRQKPFQATANLTIFGPDYSQVNNFINQPLARQ